MSQKYKISGFHAKIRALPHQLTDRVTPIEKSIVLCHLGVPDIELEDWRLTIDGMVDRTATITFAELKQFQRIEIESFHQCAGSPLNPENPTQRVCNIVWGGARLTDILHQCGIQSAAEFIWATGYDSGVFADTACSAYIKDIPVDRIGQDVLVAYEMNGKPLLAEHGHPARLFVPGFYGTNSVKWLRKLTLAATRGPGPFTTKWYNDPVYQLEGSPSGETRPVWSIAPQSIIVSPAPNEQRTAGVEDKIYGWAWADGGVDRVDLTVDAGQSWFVAELERRNSRGWQIFEVKWKPPHRGKFSLQSRAVSAAGVVQPLIGKRNAVYPVQIVAI